jgi:SHS2 domain-containing protein
VGSVTELSHTADVGFELRAARLEGLFEAAADGLAAARGAAADRDAEAGTEDVELSRPGLDRLLVAWLRELLHRSMRDDVVPEASVEEVTAPADADGERAPGASGGVPSRTGADGSPAPPESGDARLRARVVWRPAADEPAREIKGVTYHGLEVRRDEDGDWHARVVLDV